MRTCQIEIKGFAPYSPSRPFQTEMLEAETHDAADIRRWKEHAHTDADGFLVIPGRCFKQAFDFAASRLALKKQGNSKWTADIESGVDIFFDMQLLDEAGRKIHIDAVQPVVIYAHLDGNRKSAKRGNRRFPLVPAPWHGSLTVHVLNDTIPTDIVEKVVVHAGLISGIGRFRPANRGSNGRFAPASFSWGSMVEAAE